MNKRYQVFVSSTFEDLKEERNEVLQALLELDCIPCGMEYFPATNETQWEYIKKLIDDCDYYIVIIGARYGSLDTDGISFTQKEYEYANSLGIPTIGFIHTDPNSLPINKSDGDLEKKEKLEKFKLIISQKLCKFWSTAKDLGGVVSRSMIQEIKRNPRIGWVKADNISLDAEKKILELYKRIEELERELKTQQINIPQLKQINEDLSNGDDTIEIKYNISYGYYGQRSVIKSSIKVSWNQITYHLFPKLIDPVTEATFKSIITRFIRDEFIDTNEYSKPEYLYVSYSLSNATSDSIKIQLQALGLIKIILVQRNNNDYKPDKMVSLTKLGEEKLIEQRAIKKTKILL
ncbi:MAG: DUF4062 domain-containing protein [Adhaeribacter sp.]